MKYSQTIGLISCVLLVLFCFFPWISIPSLSVTLDGFHGRITKDLSFGTQAYPQFFFSLLMGIAFLINTVWAKRTNIFIGFFNLGWSLKNYLLFSMCRGGECPTVHPTLYLIVFFSVLTQVMALIPNLKVKS